MSKNQLALITPEIQEKFKPEVLNVIRTSLCPNATDAEFVLFAHKAASYGLDPFKNEIFFIKYGQTARIQFAAEAYLSKAREKEGFQPPDTQVVCENDGFKARKIKREDGTDDWEILEHEVSFPRGKIIGAYSIAYRVGYRPVTVFVDKEHIAHMYTGQNKDNWNKWEPDMIGKFAEQRALKRQYGLEFEDTEIHADASYESLERRDITDEVIEVTPQQPKQQEAPKQAKPEQQKQEAPAEEDEAAKMKKARAEMKKKFQQLGITDKEGMEKYIAENARMKGDKPTLAELTGLLKVMDLHIAEMQAKQAAEDDELPL